MKNFESDLKRLEELSNAIKQSDISLEDALKNFEEGIKLAKGMEKELDNIESKIQILMNMPDETQEDSSTEEEEPVKEKKTRTKKESVPTLELFDGNGEVNGTRNA